MSLLLDQLERASKITDNTELRDRILLLILDTHTEPTPPPPAPRAELVTIREIAAVMLAHVNVPFTPTSPISTRGVVPRRASRLFRGRKHDKDGLMAVRAEDTAQMFDCVAKVLRYHTAMPTGAYARIVEGKAGIVANFFV